MVCVQRRKGKENFLFAKMKSDVFSSWTKSRQRPESMHKYRCMEITSDEYSPAVPSIPSLPRRRCISLDLGGPSI